MTSKLTAIFVLAVLLLLGACAGFKAADKTALLRAELNKWQNFTADGVVQATHSGLTLRKLFVMNKAADAASLDVLDGGAFGINPEPLVSLYLGEYLAIRSTLLPQLEGLAQTALMPEHTLGVLSNPDSLIQRYGQEILDTGKLVLERAELHFSDAMQLVKIIERQSGAVLNVSYTAKGDPDKVSLVLDKNTQVLLLVDNISYGEAQVTALPRPEQLPLVDELLDALEELMPGAEGF